MAQPIFDTRCVWRIDIRLAREMLMCNVHAKGVALIRKMHPVPFHCHANIKVSAEKVDRDDFKARYLAIATQSTSEVAANSIQLKVPSLHHCRKRWQTVFHGP